MVSIIDCTAKCIGSDREHRFECGIDTCNRYYRCYDCYVCDPIFECTSCTTSAGKEDGDTREHVSLLNILKATCCDGVVCGRVSDGCAARECMADTGSGYAWRDGLCGAGVEVRQEDL